MKDYTQEEIKEKLNELVWIDFNQFMRGKTVSLNKKTKEFKIYKYDLDHYIYKTFGFNNPEIKTLNEEQE